jgi:hypothetical protein
MNHHAQVVDLLKKHFGDKKIDGVEIGTAEGCLTRSILINLPNVETMYAIDPYKYNPDSLFEGGRPQEWHDARMQLATKTFAALEGRVIHIKDTSDNACIVIPNSLDFVWIDGEHAAEQITRDIENYYPKVITGGILGGHDSHLSVDIAAVRLDETILFGDDMTWWVIKN